ncbi:DUF418 domain-containing protein [Lentibacillus sp. CBA3610]|uniref:DUF418 domain-containing protein n=1 Tax=Lentibacillus sp. CBA3610 TaxID=2518176 RepID=UPI0015956304|nr:DUF418 domain-containing protein [Lentibacillus sp. CBA3610]QKY68568.1 DUF418 domain-containing protein [Lentibacillus sp. CBA3610]
MMHFKSLSQMDPFILVDGYQLPDGLFNQISTLFITFFVEGKFYPMFSLLFGLGFYIFYDRLLQKDLRAGRVFSRRLTFLIILGLIHLIFFWQGDILFTYGITGFLLLFFISRQPKTIMIWSVVLLAVSSLVVSLLYAIIGWFMQFGMQTGAIPLSEFQAMNETTLTVMADGGYWEIVGFRLADSIFAVFGNILLIPTILPLFLIGLYMGKTGMFHDIGAHISRWKKLCAHSLWIGILFSVLTTAMMHDLTPIPAYIAYGLGYGIRIFTGPILMLFYISALLLVLRKETRQSIMKPFASVGRMALTNYLMQTLILVFIFHGYGLGLYGQVTSGAGILISVGVYVFQVIISTLYLKKFKQGPMESLWRKWTYKNV